MKLNHVSVVVIFNFNSGYIDSFFISNTVYMQQHDALHLVITE
jgi:hypothetical protein